MPRRVYETGIYPGREDTDSRRPGCRRGLCACDLEQQNSRFAGTGGVSCNNRSAGFVPGYLNTDTGETRISCFADGRPAPVHVLEGLPTDWVSRGDVHGEVVSAIPAVVAGFLRAGRFYTRAAAAAALAAAD